MNKKISYVSIAFILLFLLSLNMHAQQAYRGGGGDGYASATAKNVTLGIRGEIVKPKIEFSVYPNPARESNVITLQVKERNCELSLYGIDGKLVRKLTVSESRIELPLLHAGTYLVKVENEDTFSVQKLIVLPGE